MVKTMNDKQIRIGYKIGGSFEDYSDNGSVGFEILFPHIYSSYEEAQKNNYRLSAQMEKQNNGEVVIVLCEDKSQLTQSIGTNGGNINAIALKKNEKNFISVDGNTDYEPCSTKFEEIFRDYCGNKKRKVWNMEYLAYWIEPVIIMGFNWSDDEEDTHMIEGDDEFEEEK